MHLADDDLPPDARARVRELAHAALDQGRPLAWFEQVYAGAARGEIDVPWFDGEPYDGLVTLAEETPLVGNGQPALVVGCGLGDDAEYVARRGYAVTAFDLSPTAIENCRARFPDSTVDYRVLDLFEAPEDWRGRFELVVEIYTVQAMPPHLHAAGYARILEWVARGGLLALCARGRAADVPLTVEMGPPWPLSEPELRAAEALGFEFLRFDHLLEEGDPPVRRMRALARRL